jgi:hypothetical protein
MEELSMKYIRNEVGQKMFIINNIYGYIIVLDKRFLNKYTKKSKKASLTKINVDCTIKIGYEAKSNSIIYNTIAFYLP